MHASDFSFCRQYKFNSPWGDILSLVFASVFVWKFTRICIPHDLNIDLWRRKCIIMIITFSLHLFDWMGVCRLIRTRAWHCSALMFLYPAGEFVNMRGMRQQKCGVCLHLNRIVSEQRMYSDNNIKKRSCQRIKMWWQKEERTSTEQSPLDFLLLFVYVVQFLLLLCMLKDSNCCWANVSLLYVTWRMYTMCT